MHGSEVSQSEYADYQCCTRGANRVFPGTKNSYIFTVNTSDGSINTKPIKITHETGGSDEYSYMISNSGMRFRGT